MTRVPSPTERPRFVLVKGKAGLGNRIFALLTATLYAQLSGRRLWVDWSDPIYSGDGTNVFPLLFRSSQASMELPPPREGTVAPRVWEGHLGDSAQHVEFANRHLRPIHPARWRPFSFDLTRLDYSEDILVMWSYVEEVRLLRRHFPGRADPLVTLSDREVLCRLLRETLRLSDEMRERVDAALAGRASERIGVHARMSDKRTSLRGIHRRVERVLAENPGIEIFLATDNAAVRADFQKRYPRVAVIDQWLPTEGAAHGQGSHSVRLEHAKAALVDLYCLADCDHLIVDERSAFSYLAALLSGLPADRIQNLRPARVLPDWARLWAWVLLGSLAEVHRRIRGETGAGGRAAASLGPDRGAPGRGTP